MFPAQISGSALLTKALHGLPQDLHIFKLVSSRKVFDCSPESSLTIQTIQHYPHCNNHDNRCLLCFKQNTVKVDKRVYLTQHRGTKEKDGVFF